MAVPIYQTVAYAFDSADHAAALFNLEEPKDIATAGSAIPTTAVLERRVAALEGGVGALCVSTGQAALNYAALNVDRAGLEYRLRSAALRDHATRCLPISCQARAVTVRFADSDHRRRISKN